jgi:hypothetical protein
MFGSNGKDDGNTGHPDILRWHVRNFMLVVVVVSATYRSPLESVQAPEGACFWNQFRLLGEPFGNTGTVSGGGS